MIGTYMQMAAALIFVVLLIFAATFVLKKRQNRTDRLMNIIGYQSFGPKKGVAALKVGGEVLMLSITSSDIRLLKVFKKDEIDTPHDGGVRGKLEELKNAGVQVN
ncbi:MAG: flagellar biosynthetic protein FliO [Nitrospirae bacterium]|nr:flagellar biosynthetic protein FliO [Nitrospirota bacterium]